MLPQLGRVSAWYLRAEARLVRRWWRECAGVIDGAIKDRRYGIDTAGEESPGPTDAAGTDAEIYGASDYREIERTIEALRLGPDDRVIDIGCGKGRALYCFARSGAASVTGLESVARWAETARRNLSRLPAGASPARVLTADAATYAFTEENVLFLYNPFGVRTLRAMLDNLRTSLLKYPRRVRIAYFGPHADLLSAEPGWKRTGAVRGTDIAIWENA